MNAAKFYTFTAFQVAPAAEQYEQEFLMLVSSVEAQAAHPLAAAILDVARKNKIVIHPVIAFQEFPEKGVGAAVEYGSGLFRAVVMGSQAFMDELGFQTPELLVVSARRWEQEGATVVYAGWDRWVRGIMRFSN